MLGFSSQVRQHLIARESPMMWESGEIPEGLGLFLFWGAGGRSLTGTRACLPGPHAVHLCNGYSGPRAVGGRDGQISITASGVWAVTLSPALSPDPTWLLELRKYRCVALENLAKGCGARQDEGVRSEWSNSLRGLRKTCPSLASVSSSVQTWNP